jgi:hypothetical protein
VLDKQDHLRYNVNKDKELISMTNKEKWHDRFDTDIPLLIDAVGFASLPFALLYGCIKNDLTYALIFMGLVFFTLIIGNIICEIIATILK